MASFWIEFDQGGETRQASFQSDSVSIGRDRSSDFILDHPTVSRQHALIVHQGGGRYRLVVLSRGGLTGIDGQQVHASDVELFDGTVINLGQFALRFRSNEAPPKPATPPQGNQFSGGQMGQNQGYGGAQPAGNFGGAQPAGNFGGAPPAGNFGGAPPAGNFGGAPPAGNFGGAPPPGQFGSGMPTGDAPPQEEGGEDKSGPVGIVSWDEIAASSAAMDEEQVDASDFQRIKEAKKKDEKSNPVVIFGALALAVGFLLFAFLGGGSDTPVSQQQASQNGDIPPVEIDITCLDRSACHAEALRAYERAVNLIDSREVETGNLFDGYKRLLMARAYLEEGGIEELPAQMGEWQAKHDLARAELDELYSDFLVRHHQAATMGQHRERAEVLRSIQAYFPDRSARENRWAREQELQMQAQGTYPRSMRQ